MAKIKLTKSVVDAAKAHTGDVELRDTIVPGFICKVTPTGPRSSCFSTARTRACAANRRSASSAS